ncbi:MAG: ABC transporter substrate-binding protein [candidate division NC10 bacterium]|nr:ABC transporter substrate-binding protein [candidate division NC10 bacterium]MBI2562515.1 ABC transporter substrate-binding protein [candidate division NC10 bacterium]
MGQKIVNRTGILIVLAAIATFVTAPALAQEAIKIGFFAPITGPAAADGASAQHAVELGVKEVNATGGIKGKKVELIVYDDRFSPQEAVAIANKLIEKDQVAGVVSGSYSGPTRVTAPIFAKAGVPMVAGYAVHPDVTKAGESNFRNGFLGEVEGGAAGEYAVKVLKSKTPAVIYMDNDFGREISAGFIKRAQKLGAAIVARQVYKFPGEKDFRPFLTRIKEARPDLIFAAGYYNEAALIVRQAKELGITVQILGEEGFDSPKFIELAGKDAEGVIIATNLDRDDPRPVVQNFLKNYKQAYNYDPDMVGASSYDAFKILVAAIEKAGTDRKAVIKALMDTRDYNGLTGKLTRFVKGEVIKPVQFQIVKDGKFRRHGVVDNPEVITPPTQ